MCDLQKLFDQNVAWSNKIKEDDPNFFSNLSKQQLPDYLWIGCSDSRVPANQIVGLAPGDVFVHRNIANVVVHTDLNCLSVVQYAVEVLQVRHIIICGHYGCGGVKAALENHKHGLIDNWLRHIKDVHRFHRSDLEALSKEEKFDRLCELNVLEQMKNIRDTTIVQDAWRRNAKLTIHGLIYSIGDGVLRNLSTIEKTT